MNKRNNAPKPNVPLPKTEPDENNNPENNRLSAEADLPEGPVKNQDKRSR